MTVTVREAAGARSTSAAARGTILHLIGGVSTKYGGVEKYFIEVVRACNAAGYRSVFQYNEMPSSADFRQDLAMLDAEIVVETLSVNPAPIARLIARIRPDVLNTHHTNKAALVWVSLLAKPLGVRRLVHIEHSLMDATKPNLSRFRVFAYNRYDEVLGVSKAIVDFTARNGVKNSLLSVLYLGRAGVAPSAELRERFRAEYGIAQSDVVIACIAWDTPFKGLDIFLEALAGIMRDRPEVRAIVIGVDPAASKLPALAAQLGIGDRVSWSGIIDAGWQVLNAADIYVQPSRFAEGLSVATAEAMALSLPVVATRVAGPGEIVLHERTGLLCAPNDVDALREAMLAMLERRDRWPEMGRAAKERYDELFALDRSVAQLVAAYHLSRP